MIKVKELLCDIVKYTYGENCNPAYYKFYVEISKKNSKTYHGLYNEKTRKISIYNTYRDDESILCTTVHELAHHIDCCNRKTSNHQKEFYAEYRKLLYTAMNMGVINKWKFLETTKDASDSNKIRKMMDEYVPRPINYKPDKMIVAIYDCYKYKDYLKQQGYRFNGNTTAWEKEVDDIETECASLKKMPGIRLEFNRATDLHFEGERKLIAIGDTFSIKKELTAAGFKYKDKKWVCTVKDENDIKRIKNLFPTLSFKEQ